MSLSADVQQFLMGRKVSYVSAIRINELSKTILLEIPLDRVRGLAEKGFTSKRQLTYLQRTLEERFGVRVLTAFRPSQQLIDLEAGFRALLIRRFPDDVEDSFLSFTTGTTVYAWVITTSTLDPAALAKIEAHVASFLKEADLVGEGIEFIGPAKPEPSLVAILRTIKINAPVDVNGILDDLNRREFACPSTKWLAAKLDGARKRGLVVRNANGSYALTAIGLSAVPHSRSKSSTDIDRMLSLAKRRQW